VSMAMTRGAVVMVFLSLLGEGPGLDAEAVGLRSDRCIATSCR
jgi:hypothetical protein